MKSLEQVQLEVEREIDRWVFCEQIKKTLSEREQEMASRSGSEQLHQREMRHEVRLYEKIYLASYLCDFGNVVINSVKTKQIKIVNNGSLPVEFQLDRKHYQSQGYIIQPERVSNLPPGDEAVLNITYQTKKNMKFGKTKTTIPIEVRRGSKYYLELVANITIPQIVIENVTDTVDFGKVLIGQRKTFYMRFTNDKEIACEWFQSTRTELAQGEKKEEPRFVLVPNAGCVQPDEKMIVEVQFTPLAEKMYQQKF